MASVVGFDVGSKTCFTAIAKAGGIETIANEYSQRATPSYVSFGDLQRDLGTSAQQKLVMNLKNTAWLFKHLVGRPFNDQVVKRYQPLLPYDLIEVPQTKRVGIKVNLANNDYTFSIEQVLAMLLGKLKDIASTGLDNRPVSDCVIAVPYYLTNAERCAWLEAATIAGLNPLRMMNETTAIALAYGLFKTDLPEPGDKQRTVAFVDIGYTQTQVCIAQFNKGTLKVIAVSGDRNLGGLDFDLVLVKHFTEEFKTKYKMDVSSKKRAELRLYNECEKLKKLMSANATEMTMNVECIMDDKDVTGRMKRETFESLCEERGYIGKFKQVLSDCIGQLKDGVVVDSVEMVGGSCRVPFIKESITEVFGQSPSTTLNSDEAVSRGAALQCAILSPAFRVREFNILDVQPHPIRIDWSGSDGKAGNALLFSQNESVPISKVLTFTRKDITPFTVKASYSDDSFKAFPDRHVGDYTVSNLKEPMTPGQDGNIKIKVKLRIDSNGLLVMPQAVQIDKKEAEEEVKEEVKPMADPAADPKPSETPETPQKPDENTDLESKPTEEPKPKEENTAPPQPKTKKVLKNVKLELDVEAGINGQLSVSLLQSYVQVENELCVLDKKERARQDAKNQVESYVYESRDKLDSEYSTFCGEQEKENLRKSLTDTEDWLYEEDYDEVRPKMVYLERYDQLVALLSPITLRYKESTRRPVVIDKLLNYINKVEKFTKKYNENDVELAHIDREKVHLVEKSLDQVRAWSHSATVKVSQMAPTQNPEVLSSEFEDKLKELSLSSENIMNTPKPKPVKKEEPKKEENSNENGNENVNGTGTGTGNDQGISEGADKKGDAGSKEGEMTSGDNCAAGGGAGGQVNGATDMELD